MSDQYYTQEDVLPNTPEQVIENVQAQSKSLANAVPDVALALQQSGEALGQLYAQAQDAGNTGAMALISATWERMEFTANQTVQLDALKQSALEAIQTINEDRRQVIEQLGELETAINEGDEYHPALKEFADGIRMDEAEYQAEIVIPDLEQAIYEEVMDQRYDELIEHLTQMTGCKWQLINRFIGILQGDFDATPLQSAQLKAFIESLSEES